MIQTVRGISMKVLILMKKFKILIGAMTNLCLLPHPPDQKGKLILQVILFEIDIAQFSLPSRELGQAPMLLVFLTPGQTLSSHPHQQIF